MRRTLAPLVATLGCVPAARSRSEPAPTSIVAVVRARTDSIRAAQHIPGMSIAVTRHGALVWLDTFGFADVATRTPVTRNTQFRIGSVSKLITALTAARLSESRKLDLDASVRSLLPELPAFYAGVTTRELLGHLGGVHHYGRSDYFNHTRFPSVRASVAKFMNDTLVAPPGTKSFYSSYGFVVIGAEIEAICGCPFATAIASLTTTPLGLNHTVVEGFASSMADVASKYQLDGSRFTAETRSADARSF